MTSCSCELTELACERAVSYWSLSRVNSALPDGAVCPASRLTSATADCSCRRRSAARDSRSAARRCRPVRPLPQSTSVCAAVWCERAARSRSRGRSLSWPRKASAASPVQADELSLDTFADASENTVPAPRTSDAAAETAAVSPGAGSNPSAGNSRVAMLTSRVAQGP